MAYIYKAIPATVGNFTLMPDLKTNIPSINADSTAMMCVEIKPEVFRLGTMQIAPAQFWAVWFDDSESATFDAIGFTAVQSFPDLVSLQAVFKFLYSA